MRNLNPQQYRYDNLNSRNLSRSF